MRILVIGSGGREHAMVDALSRSQQDHKLFCLPGNPGIWQLAEPIQGSVMDRELLLTTCRDQAIDLVVFGPEAPLAEGLADGVRELGILVFGPGQAGAQLETSKVHAKQFMQRHGIATADYQTVTSYDDMMQAFRLPVVIKADGLAAGKGVFIPKDQAEYEQVAKDLFLNKTLGASADQVILEDCLVGPEISFFYLLNGRDYLAFGSARDHKRAFDGDQGPNTGGMGAFSPVELTEQDLADSQRIIEQTVAGLVKDQVDYRGVIFIGCMRTAEGLKVLEYNVRFGDPETQVLQSQWGDRFADWVLEAAEGRDFSQGPSITRPSVGVVIASQGYPGTSLTGQAIELGDLGETKLYHAGTGLADGQLVNQGGRVFNLVASGETIEQARQLVYDTIDQIQFQGSWYRKDIANDSHR